ncbi:MAG: DEAD/DEAH box helicase [Candidatus Microthrix sp.]|nr:DEAD/DEAH box helicase [Candidatus Microthrix sp.]
MLDPLETTRRIDDAFLGYLRSSFGPRRPELRDAYHRALNEGGDLSRGPFVQATAPFKPGRSVDELIRAGVLSAGMRDLAESFPLDRPLHGHQEAAILKSVEHERNLVVSTGTGSGKTEAFLFPIIEHLLREREAGTLGKPGVRALLLYPMNALANDQVKRLRGLLAPLPEITFGRYTGETEETQLRAESDFQQRYPGATLHPNELISRQVMKERPPHLLLTNYAMLEYLLLRPDDTPFFDGTHARSWQFLVLDEAHVYNGAQGTEVAYLLRRLKDRVLKSEQGRLRCFATSATLGRGWRTTRSSWNLPSSSLASRSSGARRTRPDRTSSRQRGCR